MTVEWNIDPKCRLPFLEALWSYAFIPMARPTRRCFGSKSKRNHQMIPSMTLPGECV